MSPMPTVDASPARTVPERWSEAPALTRPRVLFLGKTYAGWNTRFLNLQAHISADERLEAQFHAVSGWRTSGRLESLPLVPDSLKGRLRATLEARSFARFPRPDAIWSSAPEVLLPYLWAQAPGLRRPLVIELDWTLAQQETMAREYFARDPRNGPSLAFARWRERSVWAAATAFVAWSRWARDSLVEQGVPASRVHVIPPGVDLDWWTPPVARRPHGPVRLLFVGGNFERKGGPELLAAFGALPAGACELDLVTREPVVVPLGVRVHRLEPNAPELRRLYQDADIFVLPTHAECLGIAAIEAMASGTAVMMTDIGGARDIVVPGETGWLLSSAADVVHALSAALNNRGRLHEMGRAGRVRAQRLFDGRLNDRLLASLMLTLARPRQRQGEQRALQP